MGYHLEFNTILSVPVGRLDLSQLEVGKSYDVIKDGERIFPLNIPIDLCGEDYKFVAKVAVRKLILSKGETVLSFDVLKLFNDEESRVISDNFSKEA
jgi:hypothetical protein